jgi:hypothetical protein
MRLSALVLASLLTACASPYYQPCGEGGSCPGGFLCADPGRIDVCTVVCAMPDDCAGLGPRTFCSLGGVCLERCDVDADCPISSYCDTVDHVCER